NSNFQVWLGAQSVTNQATLDLSALDNLNVTANRMLVGATIGNVVNRPSGVLYLAKTNNISTAYQATNTDVGTGTGNVAVDIADCNGNAGAPSTVYLGLVNTISVDSFGIGRQKASGHFQFNPLYANVAPYPTLTLQGYSSGNVSVLEIANGA